MLTTAILPRAEHRPDDPTAAMVARAVVTPEAFREIYQTYAEFIWASLRRLGVPDHTADDALQDVFVVVHRRLPEFVASGSTKAWLSAIAVRVARDYRRKYYRKGGLEPLKEDAFSDGTPGPMESAARSEAVQILERLLGQLDDEKREAFVLVDVEGMTPSEAAEAIGANPNTLQSRLRAGRAQFEAALTRYRRSTR